jgi:signal transduction histidine kinase
MARMIGDLLDFTGTGLGVEMRLSPAPMDLKPLCQEVVDELRAGHPTRTVRFDASGEGDALRGEWDGPRLRQVLSNLLGNAIQHGGEEPVDFSVSAHGAGVRMIIRNGGEPIPAEALGTIFEPMVRGAATEPQKQRRTGSIGLGLYIAREVVNAHGGTIEVASSREAGTVFTVSIPRRAPAKE